MTDREVLKLALEALENHSGNYKLSKTESVLHSNAVGALRQALKQPSDIDAAVRAENESCAKVCDEMDHDGVMVAADCAAAIRERMK